MEIGRLVDRRLTRVHAADRENYRSGDVVVANRDVYGLREGEAWTVVGTGEGGVRLERRGECRAFAPSGNAARNLSALRIAAAAAASRGRNRLDP